MIGNDGVIWRRGVRLIDRTEPNCFFELGLSTLKFPGNEEIAVVLFDKPIRSECCGFRWKGRTLDGRLFFNNNLFDLSFFANPFDPEEKHMLDTMGV